MPIVVLVMVALGIQMAGVVASPLDCRLLFNDLVSKVIVANSVFDGQLLEFNLTTAGQPLVSVHWVAVFRVGAVHKGRLAPVDRETVFVVGSKPAQVNASEEKKDHQGNEAEPCEDWKDLEVGQSYFVFLNGSTSLLDVEAGIYWASGSPHKFSKMSSKKVKRYSCITCGHQPSARLSRQGSVIFYRDQSLSLKCSTSGQPPPLVVWYRYHLESDQQSQVLEVIRRSKKIRINRRGSRLTITKARPSDRGQYLCQAVNVLGTSNSTTVNVTIKSDATESKDNWKSEYVVECDSGYCLHQGTCYIIPSLFGRFCVCDQEFTGVRCQDRRIEPEPVKPGLPGIDFINIDYLKLLLLFVILLGVIFIAFILIRKRGSICGHQYKERKDIDDDAAVEQEALLQQPRQFDVNSNDQPILDPSYEPHHPENLVSSLVYGVSRDPVTMEPQFPESSKKPSSTNCSGSQSYLDNSLEGPSDTCRSMRKATLHPPCAAEAMVEHVKLSAEGTLHQSMNKDLSNVLEHQNPERIADPNGSPGHREKEIKASLPWRNAEHLDGINVT